jgi:hypothetical protein
LGGGSNIFSDGQMDEEGFDFWNAHFLGVAFVVEKDETANPLYVGLFCSASRSSEVTSAKADGSRTEACVARSVGVMFKTNGITDWPSNFLGGVDGIFMKARTKKLISSLRLYNATPEKWIWCYAEFCQSNALIRGVRRKQVDLISS